MRLRDVLNEAGIVWEGMAKGDPGSFIGVPSTGTGSGGTGDGNLRGTGDGAGFMGTGPGGLPQEARLKLEQCFHDQYNRYPHSQYEFETWIRHHW